ncbi:MAG: hypothetical protein E7B35_16065 [Escherichia coli]|nr:hypothetical protein [Escherichia coli]
MKLSYKLIIAAFFVTAIGSFIWSANYYYSKYQYEKKRAQEDIKVAVADDDCASRPVPDVAADRLRKYADSIRAGSNDTVTGEPAR